MQTVIRLAAAALMLITATIATFVLAVGVAAQESSTAIELPADGFAMLHDEARGLIYVTMPERNSIAVIDVATQTIREEFVLSGSPRGMTLEAFNSAPDGFALAVVVQGSGTVEILAPNPSMRSLKVLDVAGALGSEWSDPVDVTNGFYGQLLVGFDSASTSLDLVHVTERMLPERFFPVQASAPAGSQNPRFTPAGQNRVLVTERGASSVTLRRIDTPGYSLPAVSDDSLSFEDERLQVASSADGTIAYLSNGQIVSTSDLTVVGALPASGAPAMSAAGPLLFLRDDANLVSVVDVESNSTVETFSSCALDGSDDPTIALNSDVSMLFTLGGNSVCFDAIGDGVGSISGTITDFRTGEPIPGARACAQPVSKQYRLGSGHDRLRLALSRRPGVGHAALTPGLLCGALGVGHESVTAGTDLR